MITKEELQEILHELELDYEAEASLIYVFFERPDGRIDNYSISVRHGRKMSNKKIVDLMRRECPASRQGEVLTVERPHIRQQPEKWLDVPEVCEMLKISQRTLRYWKLQGLFTPSYIGGKAYYRRSDIERLLENNVVQENGRIDRTGLPS